MAKRDISKLQKEVDKNNPNSLTLFEKKIKNLCKDVEDKTLAKYLLDNYTQSINELTPNLNYKKNSFYDLNFLKKKKFYLIRLS